MKTSRRAFLKATSLSALALTSAAAGRAQAAGAEDKSTAITVDPKRLFELSPFLYMQFMEPLGATDNSMEAAWSYDADDWRSDFIATTRDLAPGMMRFGGLLSRYYKWREGIGPARERPWYRNYVWGGKESHRVGTHEFVDFSRRVGAEPLYCVNFLSDGFQHFAHKQEGNRSGDAAEAADWVSYCNDPDHPDRKRHGHPAPYSVKYWQLGNETNYGKGGFNKDGAIAATIDFARAMRARDPGVQLIAWGDNGWAADMAERAGEHIHYIAVHAMQQTPVRRDTVLNGFDYQDAPERAWEELMEIIPMRIENKLVGLEAELSKSKLPIAITEGHLSLQPHNANPILTEWLTGVYHARVMNLYQRRGARVKIATAADFNGMRWTTNAVMHQVPGGVSYLLPVAAVMRLFKRHSGRDAVTVKSAPSSLDVTASRTGNSVYLHVANMNYSRSTATTFAVNGMTITGAKVFQIAPEKPRQEISPRNPDAFNPQEHTLPAGDTFQWHFPARSVAAVHLTCA
jgi:alpha-L-arabinofuranosidase